METLKTKTLDEVKIGSKVKIVYVSSKLQLIEEALKDKEPIRYFTRDRRSINR